MMIFAMLHIQTNGLFRDQKRILKLHAILAVYDQQPPVRLAFRV
jgi:hypothetical protein